MSEAAAVVPAQSTPAPVAAVVPAATDQAAADALAAQAAKTGAEGAVKTAEQIATEAAAAQPKEVVYALTLPKDAVIEAAATERLTAFAKANGLSNEVAQKALEHANAEVAADRAKQADVNVQAFNTLARETWPGEIKADKEFGGEKFDATVIETKRAADKFLTPEEKDILNQTGWGNHPMLVKFFARVGRAMGNDTLVTGGAGGGATPKTDAQAIYPNMNP